MDDGHPRAQARRPLASRAPSSPPPGGWPPVYLLPCRIQQGWGDVRELALAARALRVAGFPLCYLTREGETGRREDPRAVPIDPRSKGPVRFPDLRRVHRPCSAARAIVLATWWGVTARLRDAEGGPLPGPLHRSVERIVEAHGTANVLHVSLEEFASDQTSYEALDEGLRQAGWSPTRRRASLASAPGRAQCSAYHEAFSLARAGELGDVVHLVSSLAPRTGPLTEFPFLLPVTPFGPRGRPRAQPILAGPVRPVRPARARARVVWYASPPSSQLLVGPLLDAFDELGATVLLEVRGAPTLADALPRRSPRGCVQVETLPPAGERAWRERWRGADLRIASGSQTLAESVREAAPFLYFNGLLVAPDGTSRAFRREKLLSLLRALGNAGARPGLRRDLEAFADGQALVRVLGRALPRSSPWRREMGRSLERVALALDASPVRGDDYVVEVARRFAWHTGPTSEFVRQLREEHPARVRGSRPSGRSV